MNRPFCVTPWRTLLKNSRAASPQSTFFCFLFFLEKTKQKTLRRELVLQIGRLPALPGTKNGRFVCESSVLCNTLANPAEEQPSSSSAIDFLLLPFLSRKKRKRSLSVPSTPCLSAAAQATSCAKGCRRTHAVSSAPYLPFEGTRRRPAPPTRAAPTCVQAARSAVPAAAFAARLPVPRPSIYPSAVTPKSAKALRMSSSSSETVRTTSPR